MKILKVVVDGIRGLPDREFSFAGASGKAASVVAITGPTGAGKTSLLEAIVAGKERIRPFGPMAPDNAILRPGVKSGKITITWELSPADREQGGTDRATITTDALVGPSFAEVELDPAIEALLGNASLETSVSKLEYFAANRVMPVGTGVDATSLGEGPADRIHRLTKNNAKYGGFVKFIVAAGLGLDVDEEGNARPPGRITAAFGKLCSSKKLAGLYRAGDGVFPGFTDGMGRPLGLTQLSDGELDALLVSTTFVRNGLRGSIILLDTPELHRSDQEARAFVEGIRNLEEDNQLIVATRSPAVVATAPPHAVFTLTPS